MLPIQKTIGQMKRPCSTTSKKFFSHNYYNIIIEKKRKALELNSEVPALVLFDRFRGQCTKEFLDLLEAKRIHIAIVPANCTDRLQPLDVSVNKAAKEFLRGKFQKWYSASKC